MQGLTGIKPDLTTLAKVIGGGMPVGAFGGSRDIMRHIAPLGAVYQAGTLSGNPVAVAAGLDTLRLIGQPGFYDAGWPPTAQAGRTACGTRRERRACLFSADAIGGMFGIYFSESIPTTLRRQVSACDVDAFKRFFHAMLERGVHFAPSAFEAGFVSAAHDDAAIRHTWMRRSRCSHR